MALDSREKIWAERLANAQLARDEMVRLVGLVNNLNQVASREVSLHSGAKTIVQSLALHLNLSYCGLFVRDNGSFSLVAFHGNPPKPGMGNWIKAKVQQGVTHAGRYDDNSAEKLSCLPIFNGESHLGAVATLSRHDLDDHGQRHFKVAVDTILPVLQTFLLRNQLVAKPEVLPAEPNSTGVVMGALPGAVPINVGGDLVPQFVLDPAGGLLRFNGSLEKLIGRPAEKLQGRKLSDFFQDPGAWDSLAVSLGNSRDVVEQDIMLNVQAGWQIPARISLTPIFYGSELIGIAGYLGKSHAVKAADLPMVSVEEASSLVELSGEAIDHMNDLLTVFRSQVQIMLLQEIPVNLRERLEMLENVTMESSMKVRKAQMCVNDIAEKCRVVLSEHALWEQ